MMETVRFLELPKEWAPSVRLLLPEIGVACAENGVPVKVCRGKGLALTRTEEGITLTAERQQDFSRALSHLPALLSGRKPKSRKMHGYHAVPHGRVLAECGDESPLCQTLFAPSGSDGL